MGRLAGKVAVITGGGKGIGRGVGLRYSLEGAKVALAQRDELTLRASVDEIQRQGGNAIGVPADIRRPEAVQRMVDATAAAFGDIHILVHAAGIGGRPGGEFLEQTPEYWQSYLDTNLTGTFLVCQAVARHMVARATRGRIITIGSINAWVTQARASAYSASKGGVWTLTRAMAWELAPHGIAVNMLAPGPIKVERTAPMHTTERFKLMLERFVAAVRAGLPF